MVVMKFGGTSVKDREAVSRLVAIVARERDRPRPPSPPVVVVSALAHITDQLLHMAVRAGKGEAEAAERLLDEIRVRHFEMVAMIREGERRHALLGAVDALLGDLASLLQALAILGEVSLRSQDAVAAMGELISSHIVAAALDDAGVAAEWVDARQVLVTTADHAAAQPLTEETTARLRGHVLPALQQGRVPVLGGFIGSTQAGVTTTLGRGGSDYSASIFGGCLEASEIQIWTDVDGMLTADPRIVPDAQVVPELSFDEASELAYFGAKVLHPSTILPAVTRNIPVRILNAQRPDGRGTLIRAHVGERRSGLAAIACKRGVTKIDLTSSRMLMAHGYLRRIFEVFDRFRTPVDVVTTSEVSVSVTIDDQRHLEDILASLAAFADVSCEQGRAIVSAVGEGLREQSALGTSVLGALEGLALEMVSQSGSRTNLTVVLPDAAVPEAMQRLHGRFFPVASTADAEPSDPRPVAAPLSARA
jgi:aspartate kinase